MSKWSTVVLSLLGGLVSGGFGGWLAWSLLVSEGVRLPLRLVVLLILCCSGLVAGFWGAVVATKGAHKARWILSVPTLAMVAVAFPDPSLTAISFRVALLLGVASVLAFLTAPGRKKAWAILVVAVLGVAGVLPGFLRGRLLDAVRKGSLDEVELLLDAGVEVESESVLPLVLAVKQGDEEMVDLLLGRGASPYVKGRDGRSAMMVSIAEGRSQITELLVMGSRDGVSAGTKPTDRE